MAVGFKKRGGEKMKASYAMLLKTNGGKMSTFSLATMLLKTNELRASFHDVDEKKGSCHECFTREATPSPALLRRAPSPLGEGSDSDFYPSPLGRGYPTEEDG